MSEQAIKLKSISKSFETTTVLRDVSVEFPAGEVSVVFGPNGCGKSTLLRMIATLENPSYGEIELPSSSRGHVGYLSQDYRSTLLPWMNTLDNVTISMILRSKTEPERLSAFNKLSKTLGVKLNPMGEVSALSGGQSQIACVMRTLLQENRILLLDEAFSALDYSTKWGLLFEFRTLCKSANIPIVLVSHDLDESIMLADRLYLLSKATAGFAGTIEVQGEYQSLDSLLTDMHMEAKSALISFLKREAVIS